MVVTARSPLEVRIYAIHAECSVHVPRTAKYLNSWRSVKQSLDPMQGLSIWRSMLHWATPLSCYTTILLSHFPIIVPFGSPIILLSHYPATSSHNSPVIPLFRSPPLSHSPPLSRSPPLSHSPPLSRSPLLSRSPPLSRCPPLSTTIPLSAALHHYPTIPLSHFPPLSRYQPLSCYPAIPLSWCNTDNFQETNKCSSHKLSAAVFIVRDSRFTMST